VEDRQDAPGDGLGTVGSLDEDDELVAPEPPGGVLRPQRRGDALGDRTEEAVAGGVAVDVVDVLEPVEVHEQGRDRYMVAASPGQHLPGAFEDQRPIGEAGEVVVEGLVVQLARALAYEAEGPAAAPGEDLHEPEQKGGEDEPGGQDGTGLGP